MRFSLSALLALLTFAVCVSAWDKIDHEIFRLRDEIAISEGINVTFYDFLDVKPSASQDDVVKAFRKRSRLLHPDKAKQNYLSQQKAKRRNAGLPAKEPSKREIDTAIKSTSERYARLAVVSELLKGEGRARYDHYLKNGFPAWRSTGYYYARYRPGLGSVLLGLFLFTGGAVHYFFLRMNHDRHKKFVTKTIEKARRSAFGSAGSIGDSIATSIAAVPEEPEEEPEAVTTNRRERRFQEKAARRPPPPPTRAERRNKASRSSDASPARVRSPSSSGRGDEPAPGPKKRVTAENGRPLIVDSAGSVFIEDFEDGKQTLHLLDPDALEMPTLKDTLVYRLPVWAYNMVIARVTGRQEDVAELSSEGEALKEEVEETVVKPAADRAKSLERNMKDSWIDLKNEGEEAKAALNSGSVQRRKKGGK